MLDGVKLSEGAMHLTGNDRDVAINITPAKTANARNAPMGISTDGHKGQ